MANHGINMILTICETRSNDANEEALLKATSARKNIAEQKQLRQALRNFEEIARRDDTGDGASEISTEEGAEIRRLLFSSRLEYHDIDFRGDGAVGVTGDQQHNASELETVRGRLQDAIKDLEADDKIGNFEIQDLLSRSNQAETLKSSVRKKVDDTASAVIGNVR